MSARAGDARQALHRFRKRRLAPLKWKLLLALGRARRLGRVATSPLRTLPDFLIVGAAKSGTTSLHFWLREHPHTGMSMPKEVRFFDFNHARGQLWYRASFPSKPWIAWHRLRHGVRPAVGEATPNYLLDPRVPARVRRLCPTAKVIVLLREPAARAYSQYRHSVSGGEEPLPFTEALAAEPERLREPLARIESDPAYDGRPLMVHGYAAGSRYAEQLERWLAVFPREQLLVLEAEALFEQPVESLRAVCRFVGVPYVEGIPFYAHNRREYEPADETALAELRATLADDISRVPQLVGFEPRWASHRNTGITLASSERGL